LKILNELIFMLRQYFSVIINAARIMSMKKISILLILISNLIFAQTHRFYYHVKFHKSIDSSNYYNDEIITDINAKSIKSYSSAFLKFDSINRNSEIVFFANPKFENRFIKDLKTSITANYENLLANTFSYDSKDEMQWKIADEFKNIGNFKVQKAVTKFGGRNWTAWFCNEISFPYGPYKFYGLPGMILEVYDDKKDYIFEFTQNKNLKENFDTSNFLESYYGTTPTKIPLKKLNQIKLAHYNDPYREIKLNQEQASFQDDFGNPIKPDFNKITKQRQAEIKKYNNPIEIDQSIQYPD